MIATATNPPIPVETLPMDLREWTDECRLITLTLDAVHAVSEGDSPDHGMPPARLGRAMLLTLMTYCYAVGIYGSEDIEWAVRNEPTIGYICARQYPDWDTLRRFRRASRRDLERGVAELYRLAWRSRHTGEAASLDPQTDSEIMNLVRRKLELAIMTDTAACE